jgi:HSP20 family protein
MTTWINTRPVRNVRYTWPLWSDSLFNDPFINEAFNQVFGPTRPNGKSKEASKPTEVTYNFRLNVAQDDKNYYIYAVLPGVTPDKIEINALKNTLTIAGEISAEAFGPQMPTSDSAKQPGLKWLHREVPTQVARFHRELELPTEINTEAVEATYENGILRLVVPQAPTARAHRIAVSAGSVSPELPSQN